ncbi:MAG: hypothetical protein JXA33_22050 [Anaerolineae bacterium]|nr:hypothetical protein [Anaerolineae bacterium]
MQLPLTITPQWITKMYLAKTGLDHLGLSSVSSDQILLSLSPGVNVLTIHPRYYSFYTFLLDEFWRCPPAQSLGVGAVLLPEAFAPF